MGGSLGLALLQRGLAKEVWGLGRNELRLQGAKDQGTLTHFTTEFSEAALDADMVVIGLPVRLIPESAINFSRLLPEAAVITDMGSTKAELVTAIEPELEDTGVEFLGSHPMCGSEKSGYEAGRCDLYEGAVCAITPTGLTSPEAFKKVSHLWTGVGCSLLELDPVEHDRLAARTSHLPRAVAAALCHTLEYEMEAEKRDKMVATGFLGMTRTAASEEEMWTQIMGTNSEHLLDAIGDFQRTLSILHELLSKNDEKGLREWLRSAAEIRASLNNDRPGCETG
ncbi:MAG: prephenate dehydrogenase [Candidatus Omnitrophica bacterium]|nr:prephenate dehydrogenase [Candidatus Omnitrophota bacterium]